MQAKDVVDVIKKAVLDVKAKQQEVISVEAMSNYLDALKKDVEGAEEANKQKFEADVAVFRAEHERNLAQYEAQQLHAVEMFRSVIAYGQAALKSAMLINGGAAAALLAFIGNIWAKGVAPDAVSSLTSSIAFFAFGVLVAAVGTAGSYFTQYCYSEGFQRSAIVFHTLTVLVVLAAFALFGFGAWESYQAFVEHLTPNHALQPTSALSRLLG